MNFFQQYRTMWLEYVIKCSLFTRKWHMMGQSLMPWNSPYGIHLCLKWRKLTLELQINLQNPKLERLNEVDKSNLKDKCGKYLHPVNWDRLVTPKVSPEIWERLDCHARGKDVKLSNLRVTLTYVSNITTRTTGMLLKTHSENTRLDTEAMIRMNTDAMALQRVSFKISFKGLVLKLCSADMM